MFAKVHYLPALSNTTITYSFYVLNDEERENCSEHENCDFGRTGATTMLAHQWLLHRYKRTVTPLSIYFKNLKKFGLRYVPLQRGCTIPSTLRKADILNIAQSTWKTVFKLHATKSFRSKKGKALSHTFPVSKHIFTLFRLQLVRILLSAIPDMPRNHRLLSWTQHFNWTISSSHF